MKVNNLKTLARRYNTNTDECKHKQIWLHSGKRQKSIKVKNCVKKFIKLSQLFKEMLNMLK